MFTIEIFLSSQEKQSHGKNTSLIMKITYSILSVLMAVVTAAPAEVEKRATPKLYLAGDSTMALGGGGSGTQGKHA